MKELRLLPKPVDQDLSLTYGEKSVRPHIKLTKLHNGRLIVAREKRIGGHCFEYNTLLSCVGNGDFILHNTDGNNHGRIYAKWTVMPNKPKLIESDLCIHLAYLSMTSERAAVSSSVAYSSG
ncbi:hypothetical protein F183_A25370 [Bryobacterales bacterium F-183]|nr:hypothetical protein F183_A25370 [Bryobacterales bacterium F-183]